MDNKGIETKQGDGLIGWAKSILFAVFIALFIVANIGSLTQVKERSMQPTLLENDKLIINKLVYFFSQPKRGDIIILNKNHSKRGIITNMIEEAKDVYANFRYRLTGQIEKKMLVKRVIGVGGDNIKIDEGKVYLNGQLLEEAYTQGLTNIGGGVTYTYDVPEGFYFVMGDNRENSLDSRTLGAIAEGQIKGKAIYRILPFNRSGKLR